MSKVTHAEFDDLAKEVFRAQTFWPWSIWLAGYHGVTLKNRKYFRAFFQKKNRRCHTFDSNKWPTLAIGNGAFQMRKNTNFNLHVLIAFCLKNVICDFRFAFRYRFRLNEIRIKSDWVWFFSGWLVNRCEYCDFFLICFRIRLETFILYTLNSIY